MKPQKNSIPSIGPRPARDLTFELRVSAWSSDWLRKVALLCLCLKLAACASPAQRPAQEFERRAAQAGLERIEIQGSGFTHRIYRAAAQPIHPASRVFVYLEGDGTPGTGRGDEPSADPTPREPLALSLLLQVPQDAIYLTRPCYNGLARPPECNTSLWTSARYSPEVVSSMAAALNRYAQSQEITAIVLVGYSGGGALAMLIAPHVPQLTGVVTVAANLDTDAWTREHDYLPLSESLNPLNMSATHVPVVHFIGERDANVPSSTLDNYLARHPHTVWRYETFDHRCCWAREWPSLMARARQFIDAQNARHQPQ